MKQDVFSALIAKLYDATLDPTEWPRAAQMFAAAFQAESCAMFQIDLALGSADLLGITPNFDAKAISEYEAYYYNRKDLWAIAMSRSLPGRAMLGSDIVAESEFLRSEIFADYTKRVGIFRFVGSVIALEKHFVGAIGIHRPHGANGFGVDDKHQLDLLLPHVSRAMMLQRRLQGLTRHNRIAVEALESLSVGMIAVDARANVLFANPTAERLLRSGLGLTCRKGCLGISNAVKQEELRQLIRTAGAAAPGGQGDAGGVMSLARSQGRPLSLRVCPLPPHALTVGSGTCAALVIFGDPDATPTPSTQALRQLYGLSPAESRLVAALVAGERLEHYAERQRVSVNTAKTLIKRVFAKTGHARQADLIRDILASPALTATQQGADGR